MDIPFVNLYAQHAELAGEIEAAMRDIVARSSFIGGAYVSQFEHDFAAFCGAAEAVAVASGTDALRLALMAVGVAAGDEVITVPNTFIATVEALTQIGAHAAFVDIDPATDNIDPNCVEAFLAHDCERRADGGLVNRQTGRPVTAILPVHLYGLPANMEALLSLARIYGLRVVEDACQAHGARIRVGQAWQRAGTLGHAAAFSFYPAKNLGAMGEGGAVTTADAAVAAKIRLLRDHGQSERYVHLTDQGWNARLDSLQCAVLSIKLRRLEAWNDHRRAAAGWYRQALAGSPLRLPAEPPYAQHVYHLFVVAADDRAHLQRALAERGIGTGLHYPIPLHLQPAYRHLGYRPGAYPHAERSAASVLSLPMHPTLSQAEVGRVSAAVREILAG
jgi:dTDP-4-amino-4,6-dideoxygalactose transaminase